MKQPAEYLDLVRHTHAVLKLMAEANRGNGQAGDISDWVVTLHFYILCTYVKALGSSRKCDFRSHNHIHAWIAGTKDLQGAFRSYRKVEEWSRDARYEGRTFPPAEMAAVHRWFVDVRDQVGGLLEAAGVRPVPRVAIVEA